MWTDVARMQALTKGILGASAAWSLWVGLNYVVHLPQFALRVVELTAAPTHTTVEQLRTVIEQGEGNFFTIDLLRTQQALEQLPWVRHVAVRRKFPWALEIELEEHVALARWNQRDLVNTYGEVFHADTDERLPVLQGEAREAHRMVKMYHEMNRLLQPLRRQIVRMELSSRKAWQIELDNGLQLVLGREAVSERLARFVRLYPVSLAAMPDVRRVDLRYRDGFALAGAV